MTKWNVSFFSKILCSCIGWNYLQTLLTSLKHHCFIDYTMSPKEFTGVYLLFFSPPKAYVSSISIRDDESQKQTETYPTSTLTLKSLENRTSFFPPSLPEWSTRWRWHLFTAYVRDYGMLTVTSPKTKDSAFTLLPPSGQKLTTGISYSHLV